MSHGSYAVSKATEEVVEAANNFNVEELLFGVSFHIDYTSNWSQKSRDYKRLFFLP